jgi:hypothetical protein
LPGAVELERPDGELQSERRRLGVDAVRPADRQREPVLFGSGDHGVECAVEPAKDQVTRRAQLERKRGVDDVG